MSNPKHSPIFVTKPFLPELKEFLPYLQKIWDTKQLSNNGPFHQQFEQKLCSYLDVSNISLFTNGTVALIAALQALEVTGEVITTPYSFVATSHCLLWNAIQPIFVDIEPNSCNLDPSKIEKAITPRTTAILPVHCYGHPCNFEQIQKIANKYNLKVIYDAAHAFGVQDAQGSILRHGDLSVVSFHATKVFTTFEGGAIICYDPKTKSHIDNLKNFGFTNEVTVTASGINGKMSEFNAALGLLQLQYISQAISQRKKIDSIYRKKLRQVTGITCLGDTGEKIKNYSYFPILIGKKYPISRDTLYKKLKDRGIYSRRYFYPLISEYPMYKNLPSASKKNLIRASETSRRVLCLPIFPDLSIENVIMISDIIASPLREPSDKA